MTNEVTFFRSLVRKERENFIEAEKHVIQDRHFRPEQSAVMPRPVGGLREKSRERWKGWEGECCDLGQKLTLNKERKISVLQMGKG